MRLSLVRLCGGLVFLLVLGMVAASGVFGAAAPAPAKKRGPAVAKGEAEPRRADLPWTLRKHFCFTQERATFCYAFDNAQWAVSIEGLGFVMDDVGASVTLADGTSINLETLEGLDVSREETSDDKGDVAEYAVILSPRDGLAVRHTVRLYQNRPFLTVHVKVTNGGSAPVEVAKISPVVVGPGGISKLSPDTLLRTRNMVLRGSHPMFNKMAPPLGAVLHDRQNKVTFLFSVMPRGVASSGVRFQPSGNSWQGGVDCEFDPPVRLNPGDSLESDPVFLSYSAPQPARGDMYYSWAQSLDPAPCCKEGAPPCWVTVEDGGSANDLYTAIGPWGGVGVRHALVPGTWEGRPGSMGGAAPSYPRNMAQAAQQIRTLGMKPGLTVDPLAVKDGGKGWTAASADGQHWLNPATPEGRDFGAKRMQQAVQWGFEFFAVRPSLIPAEVLKEFGITRTQADRLAFEIVGAAAGSLPVVPTSAESLRADVDGWLEAASCSSRMRGFGLQAGPVRCAADGFESVDETLGAAMALYGGPIEFVGNPNGSVSTGLGRMLAQHGRVAGYALDLANPAPKIWQVQQNQPSPSVGGAVVTFPGAASWGLEDVQRDTDGPARIWRADKEGFAEVGAGPVPASEKLAVFAITPDSGQPVILGANAGLDLLLNDLDHVAWDPQTGTLIGRFTGNGFGSGVAFVSGPKPWAFQHGKAGADRVSPARGGAGLVSFPVAGGRATPFELVFARQ